MDSILILAATETADKFSHSFVDALPHTAGALMVIATLTILWGVCALTAKLVSIFMPAPMAAPPAAASSAPTTGAPAAAGLSPELIAVIAAAVATVTGKSSRIVSIKAIDTSWEKAGRQSVLSSHRIR